MKYINVIALIILTITASQSVFAVPTAYDADIPTTMDSGEYVLGYEPAYVNETLDYGLTSVYLGRNTDSNTFLISQGCTLIGGNNSCSGNNGYYNTTTIEDDGTWEINGIFHVGWNGDYNTLIINDSGVVTNTVQAYVGRAATADYNSAIVSGGVWNCASYLVCGERGIGNSIEILNGGTINSSEGRIGWTNSSSNNTVTISGSNTTSASTWNISGPLILGRYESSSYSTLNVTQGGQLITTTGTSVGRISVGHTINLDGEGTKWFEQSFINVGWGGTENMVKISNGAVLDTPVGIALGYVSTSPNNSLEVTGEGAAIMTKDVRVGKYSTDNTAIISDGGSITVTNAFLIGDGDTAHNNSVMVTDKNSTIYSTTVIYIGLKGSTNTLTIANEALVKLDGYDIRLDYSASTNNFLQLQDGYFAWLGSKTSSLTSKESKFKLWNKVTQQFEKVSDLSEAEKTALNYSITYCATDEEAEAITGYDGLGGYTILTGGDNTTPPGGTILIIK